MGRDGFFTAVGRWCGQRGRRGWILCEEVWAWGHGWRRWENWLYVVRFRDLVRRDSGYGRGNINVERIAMETLKSHIGEHRAGLSKLPACPVEDRENRTQFPAS